MLRHPYNFTDPLDEARKMVFGLHFLAYMKDIAEQFEWPLRNWQTNPDFPKLGAGIDALLEHKIISCTGGGYYFCPPNRRDDQDYIGSALFT